MSSPSEGRMNATTSHRSPVGYATLRTSCPPVGQGSEVRGGIPYFGLGDQVASNPQNSHGSWWITDNAKKNG